ncbi:MAG: DinB family protein [Phycisphaeraceae bacterium]|nr:DinB family protein [Phycisphaeraceae bacterium]
MTFDLPHALAALDRTPRVLRVLLTTAPAGMIDRPYGPETWTAREVVAHLIFGEQTDWMPRLAHILAHGESEPFGSFDRAGHKHLLTLSLDELLDSFESHRRESLAALRACNLAAADLARTGRHPALGVVTVSQLLATWVVHDLNHIAQVCKAMAFQLREDVGPWEQYLSILAPPAPR